MNWKGFGRKRSWPDFKVPYRQEAEETETNHRNRLILQILQYSEDEDGDGP
jgi:hypothetical protein